MEFVNLLHSSAVLRFTIEKTAGCRCRINVSVLAALFFAQPYPKVTAICLCGQLEIQSKIGLVVYVVIFRLLRQIH